MIRRVSFEEAKEILDSEPDPVLLDVREDYEYITGHAADSVLLPVGKLDETTAAEVIPGKETAVLVYCRSGKRSARAAQILEGLGYERIYDLGSLSGWPYGVV